MPSPVYRFGPYELDTASRQLRRDARRLPVSDRYVGVLLFLVEHAGAVVSKDALTSAGWGDVAVGDNSLEQAISALRRILEDGSGEYSIETVPRQGYRFAGTVSRSAARVPDAVLDALLTPHRALVEGRAALESLGCDEILRARQVFASVVAATPDAAAAHVGLANAGVLHYEMTRADETPAADSLELAVQHAYEACRLNTEHAEAWATLGFVLERVGNHTDALAAARRALTLEPDNWRHHLRLSSIAWGEERLRAARRTLSLLPGVALAHWLAATVLVARMRLNEAERDLLQGISAAEGEPAETRFTAVALDWLLGLIWLARGDTAEACRCFERELARERSGHLYARECCANTWYAIGALHLRQHRTGDAISAFEQALLRVPTHAMARVGLALVRQESPATIWSGMASTQRNSSMERALCEAAFQAARGCHMEAANTVLEALAPLALESLPSAGWILPVEPLINVHAAPEVWAATLSRLRARTA